MRFCFGESDSSSDVPAPEPIGAAPARTPVRDQFPEPKAWEPTLEEFLNIAPLESESCGAQLASKKKNRRTKVVRRSWGGGPGDEGRGAFFDRSSSDSQTNRPGEPPAAVAAAAAAGEEGHGDNEVTSKSPFPMKTPIKSAVRVTPANIQPSPPRSSVCLASVLSSRPDMATTSSTGAFRSSSESAQDAGEPRPNTANNGRGATVRVVSTAGGGGYGGASSGTRLFASGGGAAAGSYSTLSRSRRDLPPSSPPRLSAQQFVRHRIQLSCRPSVRLSIVTTVVPHSPMDSSQQSSAAGDETKCRPEEAREGENGLHEGENGHEEEFHDAEEQNGHHNQEHDSHDNNHHHHHHHHHLRLPFHHHQPTPEEEAAKVEELRAAIGPVDGAIALFCTDACLRRYLRARSWHVKKAEKMLLETIAWRRAFTPERIRWADVAKESETGKVYRAPFTDKLGRPVLVLCPGKQNTDDHDGNIRQMVYCMENAVQSLPEGVEQMVWIIDYKGFTLRKSPLMKTSREVLHILQNHYPERLGAAILFDPPYIFQGLWKVIRPFIDPVTFQKIKFVYRKSAPSLKVMEELFDTSLLDPALGGKGDAYVYDHASYSSRMEADDEWTAKLWELDGINGAASGSGTAAV
ncbi:unnamed protein product [Closterium sp. Naga37s-1]|nr:unnamed protein product [Closterium sp. Naga37s-1]